MYINTKTWSFWLDARLTTFLYKRITVAKFIEVKTGSNPVEFSKKGFGLKSDVYDDSFKDRIGSLVTAVWRLLGFRTEEVIF
jgi:hypothetical protein